MAIPTEAAHPRPEARIVVVGADGHVGRALARELDATRIVYGPAGADDVPVRDFPAAISSAAGAPVVVNAGGFSVHPGLSRQDYVDTHVTATRRLLEAMPKGALLVQISPAAVYGGNRRKVFSADDVPDPSSFCVPEYAEVKLESDQVATALAQERGIGLILVRPPAIITAGAAGMVGTWTRLAKRGLLLRILPLAGRHHFCSALVLASVIRAAIRRHRPGNAPTTYIAADPEILTSRDIEEEIARRVGRHIVVPLPIEAVGRVMYKAPPSRHARVDFRGHGGLFRIIAQDTTYDSARTFKDLELDPHDFRREATLIPAIEQELAG
jgi:nucleoside-diphosphate-sugar epimerase